MGVLSNKVDRSDLRVGDHVYSWRTGYTYAHHGIFVGDSYVVHFTRGSGKELGAEANLINSLVSSSIPKQHLSCQRSPKSCGFQNGNSGVIQSCLDCFLEGGPVYRFEYGVRKTVFLAQVRGGTCTLAQSDPADVVIHRAMYLHQNGFGNYDLFSNNCEDFAIYCRTGYIFKGRSGQAADMDGVGSASRLAWDLRSKLKNPLSLALIVGTYVFKRYTADIGFRVDTTKVPVEDLAVYLDSSTRTRVDKTKVPVDDSPVYPASTGTRVDKTKVRVEDLAVFPDSSTGKKLPLEDLAVYHDSSTVIGVDKTKVPVEDSAVYRESSTGIRVDKTKAPVEDVAVFLDSSTGKKSPVDDLAVYLDSSTGIRVDKTTVPVEGDALFLDSSTVKNPPVAESSSSQAISRNIISKKKKKKVRQQHRRNCQLVQDVEDVAVFLDSSTGKKPPVEDLAVYLDSSTGIGVDQTEVQVEDVAVFLDSSTGKKQPPVAESSTSEAISRNRSSKKQKKKRRQQQRRNCQSVQCPIPTVPILQGN